MLNPNELISIQDLICRETGIDSRAIGLHNWKLAVEQRLKNRGVSSNSDYIEHLKNSAEERQLLIDLIVVNETWFFREKRAFDLLSSFAAREMERFRQGTPLKILSLGCSTGEEPYSIVMELLESGMPLGTFKVTGVDISKEALGKAKRALYSDYSFREGIPTKYQKYFIAEEEGKRVVDQVRYSVRFKNDSITTFPSRWSEKYDVIFCRNLLIYLDRPLQKDALERFRCSLNESGLLIVGESEFSKISRDQFRSSVINGLRVYEACDPKLPPQTSAMIRLDI